jgi:hypothetical protein
MARSTHTPQRGQKQMTEINHELVTDRLYS